MRRMGLRKLWQAAQWLKYRVRSGVLILMYHRVTDLSNDPHLVAVTPKHFAEHMEMIRKHYMPIRLQQLVEALRYGKIPTRAIVVTFDDGYADNLHEAMPLLERYDIPATVFVTAGLVGQERESWWDELDRLLLQPGTLPVKLRLSVNGSILESELGDASMYSREDYQRDQGWHIARAAAPGPRQDLFRRLLSAMSSLSGEERDKVLSDLLSWTGAEATVRPSHRALTVDELVQLDNCDLIEIGAHSMTHPKLANISLAQQRSEIQQSKQRLESLLNRSVTSFAFPFGSSAPETVAIVRGERFVCACSTRSDVVFRDADRFLLPRVIVRDWDGERFGRFLRWWIGD